MGYIYKITNTVNGKIYIGQTRKRVQTRWINHVSCAKNNNSKDHNVPLHSAIRKYGNDAFQIDTIEECDNALLNDREIYWISHFQSNDSNKGYNATLGGVGYCQYTDDELLSLWSQGLTSREIKNKIGICRNVLSERLKSLGISDEEIKERGRQATSKSNSRMIHRYEMDGTYIDSFQSVNDATKATGISNMSASAKNPNYSRGGYRWSYEKVDQLSNYVPPTNRPVPVFQYGLDGRLMAKYSSMSEAGRMNNIGASDIMYACRGRLHTAGGYQWRHEYCERIDPYQKIKNNKNLGGHAK